MTLKTSITKHYLLMEKRRLGTTDMEITPVGFGCWAIGGANWAYGWGSQSDRDAIEAIEKAVELGINWIDTAAVYGLGHAEELVGRALRGLDEKPFVFTNMKTGQGLDDIIAFIEHQGMLESTEGEGLKSIV